MPCLEPNHDDSFVVSISLVLEDVRDRAGRLGLDDCQDQFSAALAFLG